MVRAWMKYAQCMSCNVLAAGPGNVTEPTTEATGASRTVVSQHPAKLRLSGLVDDRKEGCKVSYSIHDGHLNQLILETLNHVDHASQANPSTTDPPNRAVPDRGGGVP